jgi:hypothetical protein
MRVEYKKKDQILTPEIYKCLCQGYMKFLLGCRHQESLYSLTPGSDISPFALCFAIFGAHLIGQLDNIFKDRKMVKLKLIHNLKKYKCIRLKVSDLQIDKAYLQLLTFTLSAMNILDELHYEPLDAFVRPLIVKDVSKYLEKIGMFDGMPQSGNKAMFAAILLIHARDYLGLNTQGDIDSWIELHISGMNKFGFWGPFKDMTYLQFQNGYHQYEILEYLDAPNPLKEVAAISVASLMDSEGYFAPYPGGGGCYDYDAIAILTSEGLHVNEASHEKLKMAMDSILKARNPDGGFCESHYVHPIRLRNIGKAIRKIKRLKGSARSESLRLCAAVYSPKHRRIHTHWSKYSRKWNESDLWDSYFRLMAIARIDVANKLSAKNKWGFINYPGIGYHWSVRDLH